MPCLRPCGGGRCGVASLSVCCAGCAACACCCCCCCCACLLCLPRCAVLSGLASPPRRSGAGRPLGGRGSKTSALQLGGCRGATIPSGGGGGLSPCPSASPRSASWRRLLLCRAGRFAEEPLHTGMRTLGCRGRRLEPGGRPGREAGGRWLRLRKSAPCSPPPAWLPRERLFDSAVPHSRCLLLEGGWAASWVQYVSTLQLYCLIGGFAGGIQMLLDGMFLPVRCLISACLTCWFASSYSRHSSKKQLLSLVALHEEEEYHNDDCLDVLTLLFGMIASIHG